MEIVKKGTRQLLVLLAFMLILLCGFTVHAAPSGSIKLLLPENASGVRINLYKLADLNSSGSFVWKETFAELSTLPKDLNNAAEAQQAASEIGAYAVDKGVEPVQTCTVDTDGTALVEGLEEGIYAAVQMDGKENLQIQSVIIPIPFYAPDSKEMDYAAVVSPKTASATGSVIILRLDDENLPVEGSRITLEQKVYTSEGSSSGHSTAPTSYEEAQRTFFEKNLLFQAGEETRRETLVAYDDPDRELMEDESLGLASAPDDAETGTDENGSYYWKVMDGSLTTNQDGHAAVENMPLGDYRVRETSAPAGYYQVKEPVNFSITKAGSLVMKDGDYEDGSGKVEHVLLQGPTTKVEIHKTAPDGTPVAGAKLALADEQGKILAHADGTPLYEVTTTEEAAVLRRIPAGNYVLTEMEAPEGYKLAADQSFTIDGENPGVSRVDMVDPYVHSLRVTKTLMDEDGNGLMAEDAVFYTGLFQDGVLVSEVKELSFKNQDSASAVFTDLPEGATYTVCETDAEGNPVDSGVSGEKEFVCVYEDDAHSVTIDPAVAESTFSFANMFLELPDGYTYFGDVTVTKLVKRGQEDYETNNVYYAGVFADAGYSELLQLIPLEMDGYSEITVTQAISLGTEVGAVRTVYVTETDENSNPIQNGSGLAFTMSQDKTELELSASSEAEVVITNTYPAQQDTPEKPDKPDKPDEENPDEPGEPGSQPQPDGGGSGGPSGGGSSSTGNVRTGDDTPIGAYAVLLLLAAAIIVVMVLLRKKKK